MKKYNVSVIFDKTEKKLLMCKREKDPFKGKLNFVGGKVEPNETEDEAAYRELYEETGISKNDISLTRVLDFKYYLSIPLLCFFRFSGHAKALYPEFSDIIELSKFANSRSKVIKAVKAKGIALEDFSLEFLNLISLSVSQEILFSINLAFSFFSFMKFIVKLLIFKKLLAYIPQGIATSFSCNGVLFIERVTPISLFVNAPLHSLIN